RSGSRPGRGPATGAGCPRTTPRLELDHGVLRIRDALVVHAEQLLHDCLLDLLDVAEGQVAFVELPVGHPLVDDPRDHGPDRGLVAGREGSDGRLDAAGPHDHTPPAPPTLPGGG